MAKTLKTRGASVTAAGELGDRGPGDEGWATLRMAGGGLHLDRELGGKATGPAVAVERLAKRALFLAAVTLAPRVLRVLAITVFQCNTSNHAASLSSDDST